MYRYIGPEEIADRAPRTPGGAAIRSVADVVRWIRESGQRPSENGRVVATFVVDAVGVLLVADRRSEHVACAGQQPVQSAGEIAFRVADGGVEVHAVSNQSTGYCPELESWSAVAAALSAAGLEPPDGFDPACQFRRCVACGNVTLVKDGVFECAICGGELPTAYNFQVAEA